MDQFGRILQYSINDGNPAPESIFCLFFNQKRDCPSDFTNLRISFAEYLRNNQERYPQLFKENLQVNNEMIILATVDDTISLSSRYLAPLGDFFEINVEYYSCGSRYALAGTHQHVFVQRTNNVFPNTIIVRHEFDTGVFRRCKKVLMKNSRSYVPSLKQSFSPVLYSKVTYCSTKCSTKTISTTAYNLKMVAKLEIDGYPHTPTLAASSGTSTTPTTIPSYKHVEPAPKEPNASLAPAAINFDVDEQLNTMIQNIMVLGIDYSRIEAAMIARFNDSGRAIKSLEPDISALSAAVSNQVLAAPLSSAAAANLIIHTNDFKQAYTSPIADNDVPQESTSSGVSVKQVSWFRPRQVEYSSDDSSDDLDEQSLLQQPLLLPIEQRQQVPVQQHQGTTENKQPEMQQSTEIQQLQHQLPGHPQQHLLLPHQSQQQLSDQAQQQLPDQPQQQPEILQQQPPELPQQQPPELPQQLPELPQQQPREVSQQQPPEQPHQQGKKRGRPFADETEKNRNLSLKKIWRIQEQELGMSIPEIKKTAEYLGRKVGVEFTQKSRISSELAAAFVGHFDMSFEKFRQIKFFLKKSGDFLVGCSFDIFPSVQNVRKYMDNLMENYSTQDILIQLDSKLSEVDTRPLLLCKNMRAELLKLIAEVGEDNIIYFVDGRPVVLFGGDKGGDVTTGSNLMKFHMAVATKVGQQSTRNLKMVAVYRGPDITENMERVLRTIIPQIVDLQKEFKFALVGDYAFQGGMAGHQAQSAKFPCLFTSVTKEHLASHVDGTPHNISNPSCSNEIKFRTMKEYKENFQANLESNNDHLRKQVLNDCELRRKAGKHHMSVIRSPIFPFEDIKDIQCGNLHIVTALGDLVEEKLLEMIGSEDKKSKGKRITRNEQRQEDDILNQEQDLKLSMQMAAVEGNDNDAKMQHVNEIYAILNDCQLQKQQYIQDKDFRDKGEKHSLYVKMVKDLGVDTNTYFVGHIRSAKHVIKYFEGLKNKIKTILPTISGDWIKLIEIVENVSRRLLCPKQKSSIEMQQFTAMTQEIGELFPLLEMRITPKVHTLIFVAPEVLEHWQE